MGVRGLTRFRLSGMRAPDRGSLNRVAVKLTSMILGRTARAAVIDGKKITAVVKGAGVFATRFDSPRLMRLWSAQRLCMAPPVVEIANS